MKSLVVLIIALALVGCESYDRSPAGGFGDEYPAPLNDPQITVLSPDLRSVLVFQPAIIVEKRDQPMRVQVPVRNTASRKYLIDYRILFYDADGLEQDPQMDWTMVALEPKQLVNLTANAMDTKAVRYRLEIKWAR